MKKLLIAMNVMGLLLITLNHSLTAEATGSAEVNEVSQLDNIAPGETVQLQGRSGLIALADFVNRGSGFATSGVTFVLLPDNNNPINGSGLFPIGYVNHDSSEQIENYGFQGTFDGAETIIENLRVQAFSSGSDIYDGVGLFGFAINATLRNISISGVSIEEQTLNYIGSVVGLSEFSRLSNIQVVGDVNLEGKDSVGGIVGLNEDSLITNSFIKSQNITISGQYEIGGFIGFQIRSVIRNSFIETHQISLSGLENIGGFIGFQIRSVIRNSFIETHQISLSGLENIGGFIGRLSDFSNLYSSYISANNILISGLEKLGGFVGYSELDAIISESFVHAQGINISQGSGVGGFVGVNIDSLIFNSFLAASVNSISESMNTGPFIGSYSIDDIRNSYYNSSITNGEWIEFDGESGKPLRVITGSTLLDIINKRDNFELVNEFSFPVLKNLTGQTSTPIYWVARIGSLEELETQIIEKENIYLNGRAGLEALAEFVNRGSGIYTSGVNFVLMPDSDNSIDGFGLTSIGHLDDDNSGIYAFQGAFQGAFYGQRVIIENLNPQPFNNFDGIGLFGFIYEAELYDILINNISTDYPENEVIGGVVGLAGYSIISGVHVTGNISISGKRDLGGFVGVNIGSLISYSSINSSDISIIGEDYLGGFAGFNAGDIISTYLNASTLTLDGEYGIGGYIGVNDNDSLIGQSYLSVEHLEMISDETSSGIGGFVGTNHPQAVVENSFLSVSGLTIASGLNIGPFIGVASGIIIHSYYNSGIDIGQWIDFESGNSSGLHLITGTALLELINGSGAFELRSRFAFPKLLNTTQTDTLIYWPLGVLIEELEDLDANSTRTDVFNISSRSGLHALRDFLYRGSGVSNYSFQLIDDIDLFGDEWVPIGGYGFENNEVNFDGSTGLMFDGEFIGNGHMISNMTMTNDGGLLELSGTEGEAYDIGFFSALGSGAIVSDVIFKDATIEFSNSSGISNIGILAGGSYGVAEIKRVKVLNPVMDITVNSGASVSAVGGLVGYVNGDGSDSMVTIQHVEVHFSSGSSRIKIHHLGEGFENSIEAVGGLIGLIDEVNHFQVFDNIVEFKSSSGFQILYPSGVVVSIGLGIGLLDDYNVVDLQRNLIVVDDAVISINAKFIYSFGGLVGGGYQFDLPSSVQLSENSVLVENGSHIYLQATEEIEEVGLGTSSIVGFESKTNAFSVKLIDSVLELSAPMMRGVGVFYGGFVSLFSSTLTDSELIISSGSRVLIDGSGLMNIGLLTGIAVNTDFQNMVVDVQDSTVQIVGDGGMSAYNGLLVGEMFNSQFNGFVYNETQSSLLLELSEVGPAVGGLFGLAVKTSIKDAVFQSTSPLSMNLSIADDNMNPYIGGVFGHVQGLEVSNVLWDFYLDVIQLSGLQLGTFAGWIDNEVDEFSFDSFFFGGGPLFFGNDMDNSGLSEEQILIDKLRLAAPLRMNQWVLQVKVDGIEDANTFPIALFSALYEEIDFSLFENEQIFTTLSFILETIALFSEFIIFEADFIEENLYILFAETPDDFSLDLFETIIEQANLYPLSQDGVELRNELLFNLFDFGPGEETEVFAIIYFFLIVEQYFSDLLADEVDFEMIKTILVDAFIYQVVNEDDEQLVIDTLILLADRLFPTTALSNGLILPTFTNVTKEQLSIVISGITSIETDELYIYEDLLKLSVEEYDEGDLSSSNPFNFDNPLAFAELLPLHEVLLNSGFLASPFVVSEAGTLPQLANGDYLPNLIANTPSLILPNIEIPLITLNYSLVDGEIVFTESSQQISDQIESDLELFVDEIDAPHVIVETIMNFNEATGYPSLINVRLYYFSGLTLVRQNYIISINLNELSTTTPPEQSETTPPETQPTPPSGGTPLTRFLSLQVTPLQQTVEAGETWVPPVVVAEEVFGFVRTDRSSNLRIQGTVNTSQVGVYDVVYTLSQQGLTNVTRTVRVTVVDTTPPAVDLPASVTFLQGQTIEIPFTTSDNADGRLTTSWDAEWPTELGTHLRTLKVTDAAGNVTEESVEITIRLPRVVPVTVRVNDQSVVFVLNEQQINVDDYVIELAIAAAESDPATLTWQPYQANLNIVDAEVVYVSITDASGARVVRELPQVLRLQSETVPIDIPIIESPSATSLSPAAMVIQSVVGVTSVSAVAWLSYTTFRTPKVSIPKPTTTNTSTTTKKPSSTAKKTRTATPKKSTSKTPKTTTLQAKKPRK